MALSVSIALGYPYSSGAPVVVGQAVNFTATVTNTGSAAVQLTALSVYEVTESDALISGPNFQTPNVSPGVTGNPTLAAGASLTVPFQAVFTSPLQSSVSPNNPGGAAPGPEAEEADANFALQAQAQSSDNSTAASNILTVPVLSAVAPFPVPQGGAAQFAQGANSNLIAVFA